ncbi:MAG: hypothetical protein AAGF71_01620 [Pseudomonadota bacterium]
MNSLLIWGTILVSMLGIGYLNLTDSKRRRSHQLEPVKTRRLLWPARALVFAPGVALIAMGHWAGFTIWLGALTVLGWVMVGITPNTYRHIRSDMIALAVRARLQVADYLTPLSQIGALVSQKVSTRLVGVSLGSRRLGPTPADAALVKTLEARVAALEAQVRELEEKSSVTDGDGKYVIAYPAAE